MEVTVHFWEFPCRYSAKRSAFVVNLLERVNLFLWLWVYWRQRVHDQLTWMRRAQWGGPLPPSGLALSRGTIKPPEGIPLLPLIGYKRILVMPEPAVTKHLPPKHFHLAHLLQRDMSRHGALHLAEGLNKVKTPLLQSHTNFYLAQGYLMPHNRADEWVSETQSETLCVREQVRENLLSARRWLKMNPVVWLRDCQPWSERKRTHRAFSSTIATSSLIFAFVALLVYPVGGSVKILLIHHLGYDAGLPSPWLA